MYFFVGLNYCMYLNKVRIHPHYLPSVESLIHEVLDYVQPDQNVACNRRYQENAQKILKFQVIATQRL